MLPRRYRIPGSQVGRVVSARPVFSSGSLVVKTVPNGLGFSRVGVMVSAKFLAKAHERNRLRRQLYTLIDIKKITPGFDVGVLVRKAHVR